ncbi:hypothetical protein [Paraburkholderia sp.]|uniref:hypothetical protein n=1 Tax=Paraburkholderia sp. TaxID=1926495 RepID=UPI0025CF973E|nr:hypothetical protein [Paraburkholderia sp.]
MRGAIHTFDSARSVAYRPWFVFIAVAVFYTARFTPSRLLPETRSLDGARRVPAAPFRFFKPALNPL